MSITTSASASGKTKAKLRYLKAKKERRKKRQTSAKEHPISIDEDVPVAEDRSPSPIQVDEPIEHVTKSKDKRPKKRQKKVVDSDNIPEWEDLPPEEFHEEHIVVDTQQRKSSTPEVALPSFPLPVVPDAPDRKTLALQGLDKALLQAEIIDPLHVEPIDNLNRPDGQLPILSDKMKKRLQELGITELFAVQTALLPFLLGPNVRDRRLYMPYNPPRDVCASAPTGSGKTLAYVIPIVEILSSQIVTRLRALIVLPTRDLVTQVQETFEAVSKGRGLKIGVATGQHSFAHEQNALIDDLETKLLGGSTKVDILICTPGRLIDHINGTPNFTLQHLRFLVIDEADRLLAQSFQDWLAQVLAAIRPPKVHPNDSPKETTKKPFDMTDLENRSNSGKLFNSILDMECDSALSEFPNADALAPAWHDALKPVRSPLLLPDIMNKKQVSCQKLLFSATLTTDPDKIAAVELHKPKYFVVQSGDGAQKQDISNVVMEGYAMPATLKEHMIVCESSQKPVILFHLVHNLSVTNALVFTKSAESTTRLVRLFEFFEQAWAAEKNDRRALCMRSYSGDIDRSERRDILEKFKAKKIDILVCSDLISRGIDISHVSHVVSYDAPVDMRKYVHRVGRTARAGRSGSAWTLVEEQEARFFKKLLSNANHLKDVKKLRVKEDEVSMLSPFYQIALDKLKDTYTRNT